MLLAVEEVVDLLVDFADDSSGMSQRHGQKMPATAVVDDGVRAVALAKHTGGFGFEEDTAKSHAAVTGAVAGNTAGVAVNVRSTVGVCAAA